MKTKLGKEELDHLKSLLPEETLARALTVVHDKVSYFDGKLANTVMKVQKGNRNSQHHYEKLKGIGQNSAPWRATYATLLYLQEVLYKVDVTDPSQLKKVIAQPVSSEELLARE